MVYQFSISDSADTAFCNILTAWQDLEERLASGQTIVDFNLIQWQSDRHYNDRKEVARDLELLLQDETVRTDRKVFSRIIALRSFLSDLMGNRPDYPAYINDRAGVDLVFVSDEKVKAAYEELQGQYKQAGGDLLNGKFVDSQNQVPVDQIPGWFAQRFPRALEEVFNVMGEVPQIDTPLVTTDVPEGVRWRAYVEMEGAKFKFSFNPRYVDIISEESLTGTFNHEVLGHAVQGYYWLKSIENGTLPKSFGLTTVIGPEILVEEGLAEYAPLYYGDFSNPVMAAEESYQGYTRLITNNAFYLALYEERPRPDVAAYVREKMPFLDEQGINAVLDKVFTEDPMWSVLFTVYDVGRRMMTEIMTQLDEGQRKSFLKDIYQNWYDAQDVADLASQYGVKHIPDFKPRRSGPAATF